MTQATTATATYDLMLLLEPEREEGVRAAVVDSALKAIERGGELVRHDRWGVRELAYPIKHHSSAEYHLLQFRPSGRELLAELERSLRIAEGLLRFRIVKLAPGTPEPPTMHAGAEASSASPPPEQPPAAAHLPAEADQARDQAVGDDPQASEGASVPASAAAGTPPAAQASEAAAEQLAEDEAG